ncbi:hypothetical protein BCR35DRAFT_30126 [Leucosporidium creatinivorum]|uniref:RNA polymerase II subunit B1 CTD phosphatase RPAP2 homolog n=1 Tax=Leucosporidium creatinivorum TaxID=106004 RepID=A0A1Y2FVL1_9BASI|nr:hypothetical protein BCR35DRAFT_30126 [Leucosporidium creatinivorum]
MPALPSSSSSSFPSSFRVHESTTTNSSASTSRQTLDQTSFASLQSTISARALNTITSLKQKLDQIELLSHPGCSLAQLRIAAAILDAPTYGDLLEERHMEGLCPYPTCSNPPSTTYDPTADEEAIKFKLRGNALVESASSAEEDKGAFCSRKCRARSEWYRTRCVGSGRTEMLEDVEERRREVARSVQEIMPIAETPQEQEERPNLRPDDSERTTQLLDSLTIRERPTLNSEPLAPSFDAPDFEGSRPSPSPSSQSRTLKPSRSTPLPTSSTTVPRLRPLPPTTSTSLSSAPPPIRQPNQTDEEAPMPVFTSSPVMLDSEGREVEWDDDGEGEGEEEREAWGWLEVARREAEREVREEDEGL